MVSERSAVSVDRELPFELAALFGCAVLVDSVGIRGLFGLSAALAVVALLIALRLPPEPSSPEG